MKEPKVQFAQLVEQWLPTAASKVWSSVSMRNGYGCQLRQHVLSPSLWYVSRLLHQCRHHIFIEDGAHGQLTNTSCAMYTVWVIIPVQCACRHNRINPGKWKNQPVWTLDYIWHSRVVYHEYWQLHSLGYWYDLVWASRCSRYMWREGSFEVKTGDAWETVHVLAFGHGYCLETLTQLFAE